MTTMTLRPATAEDRAAIVDVFWACWTLSYPTTLPAELISRLDRDAAEALWEHALSNPGTTTVVAVGDDGAVVGLTRWSRDTVHSLYVRPTVQGGGTGRLLLAHAAAAIAASGVDIAHLWVFEGNDPALGFYERQGWDPDGATRTTAEFRHPERRLSKDLRPS